MRLYIRHKIFLLGFGLTLFLVIVAFVASFFTYKNRVESKYDENLKTSIDVAADWLSDLRAKVESYSTSESRSDVVNYVIDTYETIVADDPNYPKNTSLEEYYNYFNSKYSDLYPSASGGAIIGMSRTGPTNRANHASLRSDLVSALSIADGVLGELVYYDQARNRYVSIVNTMFKFEDETATGDLPGSYTTLTAEDVKIKDYITSGGYTPLGETVRIYNRHYTASSYLTYYIDIVDENKFVGRIIMNYDKVVIQSTLQEFAIILASTLLGIGVLLVLFYSYFAHLMVVKNVKKLTKTSDKFKDDLLNNKSLEVIKTNINTHDEIRMLSDSFEMLEDEIISYAKRIEEETTSRLKMQSELEIASDIQLGALPTTNLNDENVLIRASIKSAKEVGGDFYDYFYIDDDHLAIIISDVSGKGVPAALFMMKAKELIKSKLMSNEELTKACFDVNNALIDNNKQGLFITAFIGILDVKSRVLRFVNAGHERPFIIGIRDVKQLKVNSNFILGGVENFEYKADEIKLNEKDKLFLHTDGLNESINSNKEEFGYDRILKVLDEDKDLQISDCLSNMKGELATFVGDEEAFDDVTMMIVELKTPKLHFKFVNRGYDIIDIVNNRINDYYSYVDSKVLSEVNIIFDELLNNYVSYEDKEKLVIEIDIELKDNVFIFDIENNGVEFNPLDTHEKKIKEFDPDMPLGGLGIRLVQKLSTDIKYQRKDDKNILKIKKAIK